MLDLQLMQKEKSVPQTSEFHNFTRVDPKQLVVYIITPRMYEQGGYFLVSTHKTKE